jgi:glucose/arabinose dehydrogenase
VRRRPLAAAVLAVLAMLVAATCAAASSRQSNALRLVKVASGLDSPVQAVFAPGVPGTMYVVEQTGLVRVVKGGKVQAQPFLDVRKKIVSGGEQGLLGLAFAPDYAKSRQFVVDYTDTNGDTRVMRYQSDGTKALPSSARQLLFVDQPYPNHNGGMVAYGPDKQVYVGMGDGGSGGDPENRAQNPSSRLGKILRLDPAKPGAAPKMVALGVRNPWRFSFDTANGDLWIGDVGQGSIEEVDHVKWPLVGLLNFGWDVYEGRSSFESKPLGPGRYVPPVAQYPHSEGCSITGGYVYRGSQVPAAKGRYFYGDYCSGTIWSLRLAGSAVTGIRKEPITVRGLTSFGQDAAGELYLVGGDAVYRLAG